MRNTRQTKFPCLRLFPSRLYCRSRNYTESAPKGGCGLLPPVRNTKGFSFLTMPQRLTLICNLYIYIYIILHRYIKNKCVPSIKREHTCFVILFNYGILLPCRPVYSLIRSSIYPAWEIAAVSSSLRRNTNTRPWPFLFSSAYPD